jgi:hypothetical protein
MIVAMGNKVALGVCLVVGALLMIGVSACDRPRVTGTDFERIDMSQEPLQMELVSAEPIVIELKNARMTLIPVAHYKVSGMVVSRKTYDEGWAGRISPIDLAIAWGKLTEPEYDRDLQYRHGHRWYFYRLKKGSLLNNEYVASHSSNHHMIPANENIRRALKTIARKNRVVLEGRLVNIKGTFKGQAVFWDTSLYRNDTGQGACELFYVMKVRIDTRVYE